MHKLHVTRERSPGRDGKRGARISRPAQKNHLRDIRIRRAFDLDAKKGAILPRILRRPVIGKPDLLIDDDLQSNVFTLAEALLEVLFRPKRRARPRLGEATRHLIASCRPLTVNKCRKLPGGENFFLGKKRARNPALQVDTGQREWIEASARQRTAMPARRRVVVVGL